MSNAKLKRNIAYQYALKAAAYIFPLLTLPYLTRVLGPDAFAVRAYSISIMTIISTVVNYGFQAYGTKEVAEHAEDGGKIASLTSHIVVLRLMLAPLGGVIVLVMAAFIPIMGDNLVYVLIAYSGFCLDAMLPDFIFCGLQDMSILTKRFVASKTVSTILIFAFIHSPENLPLVAVFDATSSLIAFIWSWTDVLVRRKIALKRKYISVSTLVHCFRVGTTYFISAASSTMMSGTITLMMGVFITDDAQISYWSLAMTVVTTIQALYPPISDSLYPHVVASHSFREVKRFLLIGMPLVAIGSILLWVLSDAIMLVLGGEEYVAGSYIIKLATPIVFFSYPAIMLGYPVLAAVGKIKQLGISSAASALFNLAGMIILAACHVFSIAALAILRSATEFMLMMLRAVFVERWRRTASRELNIEHPNTVQYQSEDS